MFRNKSQTTTISEYITMRYPIGSCVSMFLEGRVKKQIYNITISPFSAVGSPAFSQFIPCNPQANFCAGHEFLVSTTTTTTTNTVTPI
jgi:alpha/beta superfamily hydrolase